MRTLDLAGRSLGEDVGEPFADRVVEQADWLREAIADGEFDAGHVAIGLELECYAVTGSADPKGDPGDEDPGDGDPGDGRLATVPETVFEAGATKELGVHNAELNTAPDLLAGDGLDSQAAALRRRLEATQAAARGADRELVLDAMWTVPPAEGTVTYLSEHEERDGLVLASNMRADPRYCAIDNQCLELADDGIELDVPGCTRRFPSILVESLATSIQPHLQVPDADALPAYYNAGIRTLGPVLALSTNSPFLPADLYDPDADPDGLVESTHHELRIAVFEQSVNYSPAPKVRVPRDIEAATDIVDRIVADDTYAPFLREWLESDGRDTLEARAWEFDYKRSTYWRWLRCVIGGQPVPGANDERSLRLEYRPIPTQPTVTDVVGMQALTVGLLRGIVETDHPLPELPWAAAEESFYAAARDGLEADVAWVTAEGERTGDPATIYPEVFGLARTGLRASGVPGSAIEGYLSPIQARWAARTTPSTWKKARVREGLDRGLELPAAIEAMQREYVRRAREHDSFAAWL